MQKLMWIKIFATISSLFLGGCMAPVHSEVLDEPEDVVVQPDSETGNEVSFSMDADQFAMLAKWIGHENTLTIEKAIHVEQDNATLDAKAGTRFSYTMGDESGKFTFEKPYPTVKAGFAKLIGGVSLHDITINSDGSGLAATGLGKYRFRWMEDEESGTAAAPQDLPELWYWSHEGCPPCQRFEREYAENKDAAGFKPVKQTGQRPTWMPDSDPQFWWHVSGKTPSQSDVSNTRHLNGYQGWKDLLSRFNSSRSPKKFSRSFPSGQDGSSAQPDLNSSRAVARSLTYHSDHDCPRCGREQYVIANNEGPVANSHIHRCNYCGTSWYHIDQASSPNRSGGSRRFLWWDY